VDMGKAPKLALVIPAHNEAAHIGEVLGSIPPLVAMIIVVDDASTDATASVVEGCNDPRVVLIRHERNSGVGGAMRTGYAAALKGGYDLIGKMDADGQMRADELARLVEPFLLGLADYTKGNRFFFRGATRSMPSHRGFGNSLFSFLTKVASGYWHVFDSQCGFTVVNAAYLRLVDLRRLPDDYFFENAMLIELNALNARVVDVPVSTVYGDEVSGVDVGKVLLTFPPRLLGRGAARFWRKHLVTDFGPIGLLTIGGMLLSAFGAAFGGYHWLLSISSGTVASTGTVMVAVLPLMLGIELLIQAFSMSVLSSAGARETAEYSRHLIVSQPEPIAATTSTSNTTGL